MKERAQILAEPPSDGLALVAQCATIVALRERGGELSGADFACAESP